MDTGTLEHLEHRHMHTPIFYYLQLVVEINLQPDWVKLKGLKRGRPQKYYLPDMKTKIIEDNKNNVQNDTIGIGPLDKQKIQSLQD